ncbi:MAG: hypothetical protein E6Q85_02745 [Thiothrix sp.]|nr:MAG: hypothetical protein E6Q85_02745 [Thiothrix sp.]
MNNFDRLRLIFFVESLISSILWTGLPFYAVSISGNPQNFVILFISQNICSILLTLWGGILSDKFSAKYLFILYLVMKSPLYFVAFYYANSEKNIFIISLAFTFLRAILGQSLEKIFSSTIKIASTDNVDYEKLLAERQKSGLYAKLLGFGAGPLIFSSFGNYSFLVYGFISVLSLILIKNIKFIHIPINNKRKSILFYFMKAKSNILFFIFMMSFLGGGILYSLMASSQEIISTSKNPDIYISLFWITATISSLISNQLISKGFFKERDGYFKLIMGSSGVVLSILFINITNNPILIIVAFGLFTFFNPIIGIYLQSCLISKTAHNELGYISGIKESIFDLSSLLSMIIFYIYGHEASLVLIMVLATIRFMYLMIDYKWRIYEHS